MARVDRGGTGVGVDAVECQGRAESEVAGQPVAAADRAGDRDVAEVPDVDDALGRPNASEPPSRVSEGPRDRIAPLLIVNVWPVSVMVPAATAVEERVDRLVLGERGGGIGDPDVVQRAGRGQRSHVLRCPSAAAGRWGRR